MQFMSVKTVVRITLFVEDTNKLGSVFIQTYSDSTKRMELWFRPRVVGCKPLYGDRQACSSLLIKVRRRKKRCEHSNQATAVLGNESSESEQFEYDVKVLGIADTIYTFQSKFVIITQVLKYLISAF